MSRAVCGGVPTRGVTYYVLYEELTRRTTCTNSGVHPLQPRYIRVDSVPDVR